MTTQTERRIQQEAEALFRKATAKLGTSCSLSRIGPIKDIFVHKGDLMFAVGPTNTVVFKEDGSAEKITDFTSLNVFLDNVPQKT